MSQRSIELSCVEYTFKSLQKKFLATKLAGPYEIKA